MFACDGSVTTLCARALREAGAGGCQPIDPRRHPAGLAVGADGVGAQGIDGDQQDVEAGFAGRRTAGSGPKSPEKPEQDQEGDARRPTRAGHA